MHKPYYHDLMKGLPKNPEHWNQREQELVKTLRVLRSLRVTADREWNYTHKGEAGQ